MELKEIIAERIRTLRVSHKLSQADVAKELGVTQAAIAMYESVKSSPSSEILLWYADRFDVSLDYIFGRQDTGERGVGSAMLTEGTKENEILKKIIKEVSGKK